MGTFLKQCEVGPLRGIVALQSRGGHEHLNARIVIELALYLIMWLPVAGVYPSILVQIPNILLNI